MSRKVTVTDISDHRFTLHSESAIVQTVNDSSFVFQIEVDKQEYITKHRSGSAPEKIKLYATMSGQSKQLNSNLIKTSGASNNIEVTISNDYFVKTMSATISDISFEMIYFNSESKDVSFAEVGLQKGSIHDMFKSAAFNRCGTVIAPKNYILTEIDASGDMFQQETAIGKTFGLELDVKGSKSGAGDMSFEHFFNGIEWSKSPSYTAESLPLDISDTIVAGRVDPAPTTLHLTISGEDVFDASHLSFRVDRKVPMFADAYTSQAMTPLSLDNNVGQLPFFQSVSIKQSSGSYLKAYETPRNIYFNDAGNLFYDRSGTALTLTYFLTSETYNFIPLGSNTTVVISHGGSVTNKPHKITTITMGSAAISATLKVGGGGTATYDVLTDISLSNATTDAADPTKFKFTSDGVTHAPSTVECRVAYTQPTGGSSNHFNAGGGNKLAFNAKSGGSGQSAYDASRNVQGNYAVDVSYQLWSSDMSLTDVYAVHETTLTSDAALHPKSAPVQKKIQYPPALLREIPSAFQVTGAANQGFTLKDDAGAEISSLYDATYKAGTSQTRATWFDVNQTTNYVEVSLNKLLPHGVDTTVTEKFFGPGSSFVQFSTRESPSMWSAPHWTDVSKNVTYVTDAQTVRFGISGEKLDTSYVHLKFNMSLHDDNPSRTISFVKQVDGKNIMHQPVLAAPTSAKVKIFNHADYQYVDEDDALWEQANKTHYVCYVNQPSVAAYTVAGGQQASGDAVTNGQLGKWEEIDQSKPTLTSTYGMRYHFDGSGPLASFDFSGMEMYYNGALSADPSLSHVVVGAANASIASRYVDVLGAIVTKPAADSVDANDISFGLRAKRGAASSKASDYVDVSSGQFKIPAASVWRMPTDVSFVGMLYEQPNGGAKFGGGYGWNSASDISWGKMTLGYTRSDRAQAKSDLSYQVMVFDFSGGDFPTKTYNDWILDVSTNWNISDPVSNAYTPAENDKSNIAPYFYESKAGEILPGSHHTGFGSDGRLKRIMVKLNTTTQMQQATQNMFMSFRLKGPNNKIYYIRKNMRKFIESGTSDFKFDLDVKYGYATGSTAGSHAGLPIFKQLRTGIMGRKGADTAVADTFVNNSLASQITGIYDDTGKPDVLTNLDDMSVNMILLNAETIAGGNIAAGGLIDLSMVYYKADKEKVVVDYVKGGSTVGTRSVKINNGRGAPPANTAVEILVENADISMAPYMGNSSTQNVFQFYMKYMSGKTSAAVTQDVSINAASVVCYVPPVKGLEADVSASVVLPSGAVENLRDPAKRDFSMSLVRPGHMHIHFDSDVSMDMLWPKGAGPKNDLQKLGRLVKYIDVSYNNGTPVRITPGSKITAVKGTRLSGAPASNKNNVSAISFEFDPTTSGAGTIGNLFGTASPVAEITSHVDISMAIFNELTGNADASYSILHWKIPPSQIDWLRPPTTKVEGGDARYFGTTSKVMSGGGDVSFSTVRDFSLTLMFDKALHPHTYDPAHPTDGTYMIKDVEISYNHVKANGGSKVAGHKMFDLKSKTHATLGGKSITLDICANDFSFGTIEGVDVSVNFYNTIGRTTYTNATWSIPRSKIEHYALQSAVTVHDVSVCKYTGSTFAPIPNLAPDFSFTAWEDCSINIPFGKDAFGDLWDGATQKSIDFADVVKNASMVWKVHQPSEDGTVNVNALSAYQLMTDASFIRLPSCDILQLAYKKSMGPKGIIQNVADAIKISIDLYKDRAKTAAYFQTVEVNISATDISAYFPPLPKVGSNAASGYTMGGMNAASGFLMDTNWGCGPLITDLSMGWGKYAVADYNTPSYSTSSLISKGSTTKHFSSIVDCSVNLYLGPDTMFPDKDAQKWIHDVDFNVRATSGSPTVRYDAWVDNTAGVRGIYIRDGQDYSLAGMSGTRNVVEFVTRSAQANNTKIYDMSIGLVLYTDALANQIAHATQDTEGHSHSTHAGRLYTMWWPNLRTGDWGRRPDNVRDKFPGEVDEQSAPSAFTLTTFAPTSKAAYLVGDNIDLFNETAVKKSSVAAFASRYNLRELKNSETMSVQGNGMHTGYNTLAAAITAALNTNNVAGIWQRMNGVFYVVVKKTSGNYPLIGILVPNETHVKAWEITVGAAGTAYEKVNLRFVVNSAITAWDPTKLRYTIVQHASNGGGRALKSAQEGLSIGGTGLNAMTLTAGYTTTGLTNGNTIDISFDPTSIAELYDQPQDIEWDLLHVKYAAGTANLSNSLQGGAELNVYRHKSNLTGFDISSCAAVGGTIINGVHASAKQDMSVNFVFDEQYVANNARFINGNVSAFVKDVSYTWTGSSTTSSKGAVVSSTTIHATDAYIHPNVLNYTSLTNTSPYTWYMSKKYCVQMRLPAADLGRFYGSGFLTLSVNLHKHLDKGGGVFDVSLQDRVLEQKAMVTKFVDVSYALPASRWSGNSKYPQRSDASMTTLEDCSLQLITDVTDPLAADTIKLGAADVSYQWLGGPLTQVKGAGKLLRYGGSDARYPNRYYVDILTNWRDLSSNVKVATGAKNDHALRVFARTKVVPSDANYLINLTADVSHAHVITLQSDINTTEFRGNPDSFKDTDVSYLSMSTPASSGTEYRTVAALSKMAPHNRTGSDISLVSIHDSWMRIKMPNTNSFNYIKSGSGIGTTPNLLYHHESNILDASYALNGLWRRTRGSRTTYLDDHGSSYLEFTMVADDISHVSLSSGRFPHVIDGATNNVVFRVQRALDHTGTSSVGSGTFDEFTVDSSNIAHFNPANYVGYVNQSGWSNRKWSNEVP